MAPLTEESPPWTLPVIPPDPGVVKEPDPLKEPERVHETKKNELIRKLTRKRP